jgi:acetylornithine deacetylase
VDETIKLLCNLVSIDSVNPSLVPGGAGEPEIAACIAAALTNAGLDVEVTEAASGRPNVVGILQGRSPGRSLMLCGHMDTVGVSGMTAPFQPVIANGRLYGRGAEDMKGGLAAILSAARILAAGGGLAAGRLLIAAIADEEYASLGAEALVTRWQADAAVVTEPTHLAVATGHRGFAWIEIAARGIAAHGSRPREGRDAILRMGRILHRLEALDRELQWRPPHPVMGMASLHASRIEGGSELSTYPQLCTLQMERRTVAGETGATALAETESILAALRTEDPELDVSAALFFERRSYEIAPNHFLVPALEDALRRTGRRPFRGGTSFWTDAAVLGQAGIPSVIFGPGGAGLHSTEEYVLLDEVLACRDALAELARILCR